MTGRERERCPHLCVSLYSCMYISLSISIYMYTNICIYIYIKYTSVQSIVVICEARMASLNKKNKTHERAPGFPATMALQQGQQYPVPHHPICQIQGFRWSKIPWNLKTSSLGFGGPSNAK